MCSLLSVRLRVAVLMTPTPHLSAAARQSTALCRAAGMCLLNEGVLLAQVELQADQYPAGCPIRGCSIDVRGAESAAALG